MTGEPDPFVDLGSHLTGAEARQLADHFAGGETLNQALAVVSANRREGVRTRLARTGLGTANREATVRTLRALQGALDRATVVTPVWTAPAGLAGLGQLTSSIFHLVDGARDSITCATFNLQPSSTLWLALVAASGRPDLSVRLYLDTRAADARGGLTTDGVAQTLGGATVLRTRAASGHAYVRTHAKFLVVDHRFVVVTSANLSASAEKHNVELGLIVEDRTAAARIETQMRLLEGLVYEVVRRT